MAEFSYPDARRLDLTEEIFGHVVRDPYRWLEELDSAETRDWLAAQDVLFAAYAAPLPGREAGAERITELMRSGSVSAPAWRGDRRFFMRRTADQEHAVLFTAVTPPGAADSASPAGQEQVIIDPM